MAAPMLRGANVALTREVPGLTTAVLGVSWNAGGETALADSLVAATLLCDKAGHVLSPEHFIFFNQLASPDLSVTQLEAALGEDQEQVDVTLAAVPAEIERIIVVVYINEGLAARRTLGQLRSCVVRVLDGSNPAGPARGELLRSENLAPGLRNETALSLGELYRREGDWKFRVLGQGYAGGLSDVAKDFGLTL